MLRPPRLQMVTKFLFPVSALLCCVLKDPALLWFCVMVTMWFLFRALCLSLDFPSIRIRSSGRGRCPLGYGQYRCASFSSEH
jgi:hypothetical protein